MWVLVVLDIQNFVKDRAENVGLVILVCAVLERAVAVVCVLAVRAVLVAALEALLEVILILAAVDAVRVADRAAAVDVRA